MPAQALQFGVSEKHAQHGAAAIGSAASQPQLAEAMAVDAMLRAFHPLLRKQLQDQGGAEGTDRLARLRCPCREESGDAVGRAGAHQAIARQGEMVGDAAADRADGGTGLHDARQQGGCRKLFDPCRIIERFRVGAGFQGVVVVAYTQLAVQLESQPVGLMQKIAGNFELWLALVPQQLGQPGCRRGRLTARRKLRQCRGLSGGAGIVVKQGGAQGVACGIAQQHGGGSGVDGNGAEHVAQRKGNLRYQFKQGGAPQRGGLLAVEVIAALGKNFSRLVDDGGAGAAGAEIDTEKGVRVGGAGGWMFTGLTRCIASPCISAARIRIRLECRQIDARQGLPARLAVLGHDIGEDAATHVELGRQAHEARLGGGSQVVEDVVGDRLVEERPRCGRTTYTFSGFSARRISGRECNPESGWRSQAGRSWGTGR